MVVKMVWTLVLALVGIPWAVVLGGPAGMTPKMRSLATLDPEVTGWVPLEDLTELTPPPCQRESNPDLLILVHSAPKNAEFRQSLRSTWTRSSALLVTRTVFLIGRSEWDEAVRQEGLAEGDVFLYNEVDSYRNMTLKHILGYRWALAHCRNVPHVLKVDDDVWLDTNHLLTYLKDHDLDQQGGFLLCYVIRGGTPIRSPGSKSFVSRTEFSGNRFPNYCSGSAYVTTPEVMVGILDNLADDPGISYMHVDDALVTGVARPAGVQLFDWANSFLNDHDQHRQDLLTPGSMKGYSPELMVAFDLSPPEIGVLHAKADTCLRHSDRCYDLLHKIPLDSRAPRRVVPDQGLLHHPEL